MSGAGGGHELGGVGAGEAPDELASRGVVHAQYGHAGSLPESAGVDARSCSPPRVAPSSEPRTTRPCPERPCVCGVGGAPQACQRKETDPKMSQQLRDVMTPGPLVLPMT